MLGGPAVLAVLAALGEPREFDALGDFGLLDSRSHCSSPSNLVR